jgi:hypothetical protein
MCPPISILCLRRWGCRHMICGETCPGQRVNLTLGVPSDHHKFGIKFPDGFQNSFETVANLLGLVPSIRTCDFREFNLGQPN